MTRDELVQSLKSIKRTLDDRITIVRSIIGADGTKVGEIRRTVLLPKETSKKKERK